MEAQIISCPSRADVTPSLVLLTTCNGFGTGKENTAVCLVALGDMVCWDALNVQWWLLLLKNEKNVHNVVVRELFKLDFVKRPG
jgi:hypothetical protein